MKRQTIKRIALATGIGLAGVVGCISTNKNNLPEISGEVTYSVDREEYLFGCSSKIGIKNMFLFDGKKSFCLEPEETNSYPIGQDIIKRWFGKISREIPKGRYDLMVMTDDYRVFNAGNYDLNNQFK